MLTREERLITMKGADLIRVADKYGVKVSCNKSRTQLKESKDAVIARILAVENQIKAAETETQEAKATETQEVKTVENPETVKTETQEAKAPEAKAAETTETETPKAPEAKAAETKARETKGRAATNVISYNGKIQSIKDWGKELGIPYHTLYDRIKRNGWTIEEALKTPLGGRRPK